MVWMSYAPALGIVVGAVAIRTGEFGVEDKVKLDASEGFLVRSKGCTWSFCRGSQFPRALMGAVVRAPPLVHLEPPISIASSSI